MASDSYVNRLVRILATRCMNQATYFCASSVRSPADFHHYGLASPIYTHFTSPIRRYADVIVHRLLAATIGEVRPCESDPTIVLQVVLYIRYTFLTHS